MLAAIGRSGEMEIRSEAEAWGGEGAPYLSEVLNLTLITDPLLILRPCSEGLGG